MCMHAIDPCTADSADLGCVASFDIGGTLIKTLPSSTQKDCHLACLYDL